MCIKQNTEFSLQLTHQSTIFFFPFAEIGQDIGCGGIALFSCQKWVVGLGLWVSALQNGPFNHLTNGLKLKLGS
jgi:hypothetical protein